MFFICTKCTAPIQRKITYYMGRTNTNLRSVSYIWGKWSINLLTRPESTPLHYNMYMQSSYKYTILQIIQRKLF